jgi:hypothetical protein
MTESGGAESLAVGAAVRAVEVEPGLTGAGLRLW